MTEVHRFGRTGRFDYLTMLGKLGFANIIPDSPYVSEATGPMLGAKLLFGKPATKERKATIDTWLIDLANYAGIGMQELEDALCNWQKSPHLFKPFRG